VHGLWPSSKKKEKSKCPGGVPAKARATQNQVGLVLPWEWWIVTLFLGEGCLAETMTGALPAIEDPPSPKGPPHCFGSPETVDEKIQGSKRSVLLDPWCASSQWCAS